MATGRSQGCKNRIYCIFLAARHRVVLGASYWAMLFRRLFIASTLLLMVLLAVWMLSSGDVLGSFLPTSAPPTRAQLAVEARLKAAYREANRPVRQGSLQYRLTDFRFVPTLGTLRAGGHDSLFLVVTVSVLNYGPTAAPLNSTTFMLTDEGDNKIARSVPAEAELQRQAGADTTLFATQCRPHRLAHKKMAFVVAPYLPYWLYRLWLGDNTLGWPDAYVNCYENHRSGG